MGALWLKANSLLFIPPQLITIKMKKIEIARIVEIALCLMAQNYYPKQNYIDFPLYVAAQEVIIKNE